MSMVVVLLAVGAWADPGSSHTDFMLVDDTGTAMEVRVKGDSWDPDRCQLELDQTNGELIVHLWAGGASRDDCDVTLNIIPVTQHADDLDEAPIYLEEPPVYLEEIPVYEAEVYVEEPHVHAEIMEEVVEEGLADGLYWHLGQPAGPITYTGRPSRYFGGEGANAWIDPHAFIEKYRNPDRRLDVMTQFEPNPGATMFIIWMMQSDPNYDVRRKAWRMVRARWKHHIGNPEAHEQAALWLADHGNYELAMEAQAALHRYSR